MLDRLPLRIIAGEHGIVVSFGADLDLSFITERDIEWFKRDGLEKRHAPLPPGVKKHKDRTPKLLSNRTKNNCLLYLKCILGKAHRCGGLPMIPEISMYPINNQQRLMLDLPTFTKLLVLKPAPPKPHRAFLLIPMFTGQRWGDLARMEKCQIQGSIVKGTLITYRPSKTPIDMLNIPLPELLAQKLLELAP